VRVEVPGLVALPLLALDSPFIFWRLTGKADEHPSNHWGTPNTIESIQLIARDFFEGINPELTSPLWTLGINDMSLPLGGLFDIAEAVKDGDRIVGRLPPDWLPPHKSHRVGTSVDVDPHLCTDPRFTNCRKMTFSERKFFWTLCELHGGTIVKESPIHCELPF
jgi:hypothetical protein